MTVYRLYLSLHGVENVMLSGTHTHSGPAGYAHYALYNLMAWGFWKDNFDVICNGIVAAIQMAHENLQDSTIYINSGELLDSNLRYIFEI